MESLVDQIFSGVMSLVCVYAICAYIRHCFRQVFRPAPSAVRARVMRATIDEQGITFSEAAYCRSIEEAQQLIEELRLQYPFNSDFYYEQEGDGRAQQRTKGRTQSRARR